MAIAPYVVRNVPDDCLYLGGPISGENEASLGFLTKNLKKF